MINRGRLGKDQGESRARFGGSDSGRRRDRRKE